MTAAADQHTIWLWLEGVFARRIAYMLLTKGLAASVADLRAGVSTKPELAIIPVHPRPPLQWESESSDEPPPTGASNPCMRTTDGATGRSRFVHESTSIMLYLEALYPEPPMQPSAAIDRARVLDMVGLVNLVAVDTNYFLRNTVPEHGAMMGLPAEHQSRAAALNAKSQERRGFLRLQEWALANGLGASGWLTPGLDGPGLVDLALVPNLRFIELVYGIDTLEDEALRPLADWYARFKALPWWAEYEERDGILPGMLGFGRTSRAAWVESGEF